MHDVKGRAMASMSQTEIDRIYRAQHRIYWEADFFNRCIDRRSDGIEICDLPYASLDHEKMILDMAYGLYLKMEDCNVAYNDTLDAMIDEIEQLIANGTIGLLKDLGTEYLKERDSDIYGEETSTSYTPTDGKR